MEYLLLKPHFCIVDGNSATGLNEKKMPQEKSYLNMHYPKCFKIQPILLSIFFFFFQQANAQHLLEKHAPPGYVICK